MKSLLILISLITPAMAQQVVEVKPQASKIAHIQKPAVFGFSAGMSKDQILTTLGQNAVKRRISEDTLLLNSAPQPHPAFAVYEVTFSPAGGLVRVIAFTDPIPTNSNGEQVKEKFSQISDALENKYGDGFQVDRLTDGSIWHEAGEWMMSLLEKDRDYFIIWPGPGWPDSRKLPNRLTGISLEVKAVDRQNGMLALTYEFEGFSSYANAKRQKQDSAF